MPEYCYRIIKAPTDFDDFTSLADRDYSDCSQAARENAELLERLMQKQGFKPYFVEWWHFSDSDNYEVDKNFTPPSDVEKY